MNNLYSQNVDESKCKLIDKIIGGMKSEFNKNNVSETKEKVDNDLDTTRDKNDKNDKIIHEHETSQVKTEIVVKSEVTSEISSADSDKQTGIIKVELEVEVTDENEEIDENATANKKTNAKVSKLKANIKSDDNTDTTKPRIVLTLRTEKSKTKEDSDEVECDSATDEFKGFDNSNVKPTMNSQTDDSARRSLRSKNVVAEPELKRSARRRSKDCTESVLQSAIARKEKSYNETAKPQRLTRRLKPTPKILANLEMCQKIKNDKNKEIKRKPKSPTTLEVRKSFDRSERKSGESDEIIDEKPKKPKRKLKIMRSKPKKIKTQKDDSEKESDSDDESNSSSQEEDIPMSSEESKIKRSPRKSSESDTKPSRRSNRKLAKSEGDVKIEDDDVNEPLFASIAEQESFIPAQPESSMVTKQSFDTLRCLCQHKSQIYIATSNSSGSYLRFSASERKT